MVKLPLAITCGDPAGIGIEVFLTAHKEIGDEIPMVLFADQKHLPDNLDYTLWSPDIPTNFDAGVAIYQINFDHAAVPGQADPQNNAGVILAIEQAVHLTQKGQMAGLCTAPINKANLKEGSNFKFPGHTEFLAHLCGIDKVVMMLTCPTLSVVPLTIHIPISEVPHAITRELFRTTVKIIQNGLQNDFGIKNPRICVAGLNPHASEGGKIGSEDIERVTPWVAELQAQGLSITGPHSADTMFHATARAAYDVALCMYHDQALIPIKTLDFSGGVNVTLGLPIVRTSPDHGTAFDIAGQGIADATSMIQAIRTANQMIEARNNAN
ncbi:MAG: 4-hydroxythreonine-4-phosphate dehydrogenase PdxA [Planktomarina sp.]|nr:4-hydroxythreonine-4-phosphate dehydrogenase PdxA [Planktomarina sp.]|tara:strand:- start:1368 stop:2342 length:975 start_codon:yes stop_codon:yes gene_type:complete